MGSRPITRAFTRAAGAVDRAVLSALNLGGRGERAQAVALSHNERMKALGEFARVYDRVELLDDDAFFCSPRPDLSIRAQRSSSHVWDLSWASEYEPFCADVRDRYLSRTANRTAWARVFRAGPPRPAVVLVHGYRGGQWAIEERQWPIRWLYARGFDVALFVLPFHGRRADGGAPPLPSSDPRFTNEGFRQTVFDFRALSAWLRAQGSTHTTVVGMSLGGYTTSLLATLESNIDACMPIVPLASIADFARAQGNLGQGAECEAQHQGLERVNRVVSPLARPLRVPKHRTIVVGAEADRITPIRHAERIADAFDVPLMRIQGSHLLQWGRDKAFRAFCQTLEADGILPPRQKQQDQEE
jgi:hypothetical protein